MGFMDKVKAGKRIFNAAVEALTAAKAWAAFGAALLELMERGDRPS